MSSVSLQNVARMQYAQFLSAAAWVCFSPRSFYTFVLHATPSDNFDTFYSLLIALQLATVGIIFVAVAQFHSEAAQRKVLQYSFGGYFVLGATQFLHNKDDGIVIFGISAANVVLMLAAVYVLHKEKKLVVENEERDSCALKISLRALYGLSIVVILLHYFELSPSITARAMKNPVGFAKNLHFTRIMESVRCISAGALMGVAQVSNIDMKKTVQYLLFMPILTILMLVNNVEFFTEDTTNFAFTIQTFFFVLFMQACYPSSCAKTTIRMCYFCLSAKACFAVLKTRVFVSSRMPFLSPTSISEPMGKIIGLQYASIALLFMAASQCNEQAHRKFLQYSLAGNMLKAAAMYFLLKHIDWESVTACLICIGVLYNKTIGLDKLCKSPDSKGDYGAGKPSPTRSTPKRSSTPGSKKKKSK